MHIGTIVGGLLGVGWLFTEGVGIAPVTFLFIFLLTGIVGAIAGGWASGLGMLVALILYTIVFFLGSRLVFSRLGFKTIICQHCLQYTRASASYYRYAHAFVNTVRRLLSGQENLGKWS